MATSVTSGIYNVSSGVTETGDYVAQTGLISVSEGGEVKGDHLGLVVGSFKTSIDGTGGTIVTDPPVANSAGLKPH